MSASGIRADLETYLKQHKAQPKQMLESMRKRYIQEQEKLTIGREGAFGELTTAHVKALIKQPQMPMTARNILNFKNMREERMRESNIDVKASRFEKTQSPPGLTNNLDAS